MRKGVVKQRFFDFKRGKSKKIAILTAFLFMFLAGGALLKMTQAQNGDFADNIRTFMEMVSKKEDGGEKTEFLSGEKIAMESRIEVSSGRVSKSYDDSYLLIKIPKKYLDSKPAMASTSAVSSEDISEDNDNYIYRANYKTLPIGSINSINYVFKFKNPDTPRDYKAEIVHELYDKDNKILSRQSKVLNTLKVSGNTNSSLIVVGSKEKFIARYKNKEKTDIDTSYYTTRDHVNLLVQTRYLNGRDKVGTLKLQSLEYKVVLPEHTYLSPNSINEGWSFDQATRTATYIQTEKFYDINKQPYIKLRYDANTPSSILGKPAIVKATVVSRFENDAPFTENMQDSYTPNAFYRPEGSTIGISKRAYVDRSSAIKERITQEEIDGVKGPKTIYNINNIKSDQSNGLYWDISTSIKNIDYTSVPINYIKDSLEDRNQYIDHILFRPVDFDLFDKLGISHADVFATVDGKEQKVGRLTKDNYNIKMPPNTSGFRVQFPNNTKVPVDHIDLNHEGRFVISAYTKFIDLEKTKNSIKPNTIYTTVNTASLNVNPTDPDVEYHGLAYLESVKTKVKNFIEVKNSDSIVTLQGRSPHFERLFLSYAEKDRPNEKPGASDYESLELRNPKYALLFSDEIGLSEKAKRCIKNGDCSVTKNYKNSHKQLLRINDKIIKSLSFEKGVGDLLNIEEVTPNEKYDIDFITTWDKEDSAYYGDGLDDLDFDDDGSTSSTNIARSSTSFVVSKPKLVAIKKYISKHQEADFSNFVGGINPGQKVDYRISIINFFDRPLPTSRVLDVLPYARDRKIVETNGGYQEMRGSKIPVTLTGPLSEHEGFTIKYSTSDPGKLHSASWNKNFVDKSKITDWSQVRMIKIEQNKGFSIPAQTAIHFTFTAQTPENAKNNDQAINTAGVSISPRGNMVESNPVTAQVNYNTTVEGFAFEDVNSDGTYDPDIPKPYFNTPSSLYKWKDEPIQGYTVNLVDGSGRVISSTKTDEKGHYSLIAKYSTEPRYIQFVRNDLKDITYQSVGHRREGDANDPRANHATEEYDGKIKTVGFMPGKDPLVIRNAGIQRRRTTAFTYYLDDKGNDIATRSVIKYHALYGEPYESTNKPKEITHDNLVYTFDKLADDSSPEQGTMGISKLYHMDRSRVHIVKYIYKPKEGGKVEAKFVKSGTDQEISPSETIKADKTQVGTEYSTTPKPEIEHNGLKYTYKQVSASGAPQNGRVVSDPQTVIFEYSPKIGKPVNAVSKIISSNETILTESVTPKDPQSGSTYSSTPKPEIVHNGITYVFSSLLPNSAPQNGRVSENEQTIIYGYVPKKGGQVMARYVDQNNQSIKNSKVIKNTNTPVGTDYNDEPDAEITSSTGLVYVFDKIISGTKSGKVDSTSKEVIYQYKPKAGKGVTVNFINENNNSPINSSSTIHKDGDQIGTPFKYNPPKEITDDKGLVYTIKSQTKEITGKISDKSQNFEVKYSPKKGGKVEAKFVGQDGKEIKSTEEVQKPNTQVGTSYSYNPPKEITKDGLVYVFEKLSDKSAPEIGRVKDSNQTIIFTYKPKKGEKVVEKFLDENGKPIKPDNILKNSGSQIGDPFESSPIDTLEINGRTYKLQRTEGSTKGFVSSKETIISYTYKDVTKISAPNTGIFKNIINITMVAAGALLTIITADRLRKIMLN